MKTSFANTSRHRSLFISSSFLSDRLPRKNRQSTGRAHSSWLSRTKSRDYHAPSPRLEKELRGSCATPPHPFLPFAFLHPLSRPSWPLPSFYFESAILSRPQILAQHASPPFLFTASKLLLFAYLLPYPGSGPDFVHTAWSILFSLSQGNIFLLERKRRYREKEQAFLARGPVHARFFFRPILQRGYI